MMQKVAQRLEGVRSLLWEENIVVHGTYTLPIERIGTDLLTMMRGSIAGI